jgi:hypothetical protein
LKISINFCSFIHQFVRVLQFFIPIFKISILSIKFTIKYICIIKIIRDINVNLKTRIKVFASFNHRINQAILNSTAIFY